MVFVCTPVMPALSAPAFTWEVKANDRAYNNQFEEKAFLCLWRKKYKVGTPAPPPRPLLPPLARPPCPQF